MPTSRGLSAGSSDVARFLDTAHKARYVEIFESQVLKTAKSSNKDRGRNNFLFLADLLFERSEFDLLKIGSYFGHDPNYEYNRIL